MNPSYARNSLLAFPGSSQRVSGEIENEFSKYSVRMLDASLICVIDVCSAIVDQHNKAGNFTYFDVISLWKRTKSYEDRVLGLYHDVLSHLYQDTASLIGLPVTAKCSVQTTRFGNNRMSGDVGDFGGVTVSFTRVKAEGIKVILSLTNIFIYSRKLELMGDYFSTCSEGCSWDFTVSRNKHWVC